MGSRSVSVALTFACFFKTVFLAVGLEGTLGGTSASIEFSLFTSGLRVAALFTVVSARTGEVVFFVTVVLARVARVVPVAAGAGAGFDRVEARVEGTALEAIAV
ncbi:hypothetical protein C0992_007557 [Termitomyces sp. T32_za158]|nr:hypothetical protein C0992_007557 [Termitomyces sp. T32_za158]